MGECDDYELINTTSHSRNWSVGLSPFVLGPVWLYDDYEAKTVENGWQYSKVYKPFTDKQGNPTDEYFKWAKKGWDSTYANRYPMGKGNKPLYSYWEGKKLGYIDARKEIYIPLYALSVIQSDAFKRLKQYHESGKDIILLDFDGYDHKKLGMSYDDVINDETKTMGHAFIIAMLLENFIIV